MHTLSAYASTTPFRTTKYSKNYSKGCALRGFFYLREVVMSNQNEAEFSGVIVTSGDLSLEERVTALEKQLTDMQAAMSCDLEASKSTIFSIQATIENNEKAFAKAIKDVLVNDLAKGGPLKKLLI
ncbi:hypothetical protein [Providencia sp. PROV178]|nr:hypothetical protein [Providencia sp. PROV178]